MIEVEYKGGNAVTLTTKNFVLAIDPNVSSLGLKWKEVKNVVEIATENRFLNPNRDDILQLEGPGEYEVGNFTILGIATKRHIDFDGTKQTTTYRVEVGDIKFAIVGNIDAGLTEEVYEGIGVIDILIIPVGGGGYTLDAKEAAKIARHIEPKVVIPVHYADGNINYEVPQDTIEVFNEEFKIPVETTTRYKVKSSSTLPATMTTVMVSRTA